MKVWITAVLLVTFASGTTTGVFLGRATAPVPEKKSVVDRRVDELKRLGVTKAEELDEARQIYQEYESQILELKKRVKDVFKDHLDAAADEAEGKIRAILKRNNISVR